MEHALITPRRSFVLMNCFMMRPTNEKRLRYIFSPLTAGIKHSGKLIALEYSDKAAIQNHRVRAGVSAKVTEPEAQNLTALGIYRPGAETCKSG
jgi:hypothetical protein